MGAHSHRRRMILPFERNLLKDIRPNQLVQMVKDACQGKTQPHPDIAQKLMAMIAGTNQPTKKDP